MRIARRSYKVAARTRQRVRSSAIVPNQQEQTVMGTTADKIAGKIGSQLRSKIIDLSGLHAAKDIFEEAQLDADGLKKLISKGHDPCHAVYIFAQRFASVPVNHSPR